MLEKGSKMVYKFWISDGNHWLSLQHIAKQVFTLSCSTASSEQIFLMFGQVHTKLRNSLTPNNIDKLVYIKLNCYLLSENKLHFEEEMTEGNDDFYVP